MEFNEKHHRTLLATQFAEMLELAHIMYSVYNVKIKWIDTIHGTITTCIEWHLPNRFAIKSPYNKVIVYPQGITIIFPDNREQQWDITEPTRTQDCYNSRRSCIRSLSNLLRHCQRRVTFYE